MPARTAAPCRAPALANQVKPISYLGNLNKGITYLKQDNFEDAETFFLNARDTNPGHPSGHYWLAEVCRMQRFDYDEVEHLEAFMRVGKKDHRRQLVEQRLQELNASNIELNPDSEFVTLELIESMARVMWKSETHREQNPDARGYRLTYAEQVAIVPDLLLPAWDDH